jgi:hypothetical protein
MTLILKPLQLMRLIERLVVPVALAPSALSRRETPLGAEGRLAPGGHMPRTTIEPHTGDKRYVRRKRGKFTKTA